MLKRFFTPPEGSYFLFGPRGTGKSTWLKANYPNAYWIDLLEPETFRLFTAGPERLRQILAEQQNATTVVIDEVQKVPDLLNVVHTVIEEKREFQFVLTGSSARKLKRHGVNLLGGRAALRHMPPFFAGELGDRFDLKKNGKLGMLPIVLDSPTPEEVLRAYAGIYLKEEVQAEGIVRSVGDFSRFLETMSFSHGSTINASNIARESQIARKTVESYLLILEDLLLSFHVDVFRWKAKRALAGQPKFYYFDAGVQNSLRPTGLGDVETERDGHSLEGLVAQHLKAWVDAQIASKCSLQYWRTASQLEVDFIVTGPGCFLAIEVKNGTAIHPNEFHGLEAFKNDYPEASTVLLYRGRHRYRERGVLCCPVEEFLLNIHPARPLPESGSIAAI